MEQDKFLKKKVVRVPLYGGNLLILAANHPSEIQKVIPEFDKTRRFYAHAWHINYRDHDGFAMILNFGHSKSNINHGTIAHEAMHLVHYIADLRGIRADFNNDESLTYLISWIVTETYKFLEKENLKVHVKM